MQTFPNWHIEDCDFCENETGCKKNCQPPIPAERTASIGINEVEEFLQTCTDDQVAM